MKPGHLDRSVGGLGGLEEVLDLVFLDWETVELLRHMESWSCCTRKSVHGAIERDHGVN